MILYKIATTLTRKQKQLFFMVFDAIMVSVAMAAAILLNSSIALRPSLMVELGALVAVMTVAGLGYSVYLGLPRIKLNAYEMRGIIRTAIFSAAIGITGAALNGLISPRLPVEVFVIFSLFYLVAGAAWRILLRQFLLQIYRRGQSRMRGII